MELEIGNCTFQKPLHRRNLSPSAECSEMSQLYLSLSPCGAHSCSKVPFFLIPTYPSSLPIFMWNGRPFLTFSTQTLGSNPGRTPGKPGAAPSLPADRVSLLSYTGRALCRARSWRWCFEFLAGKYQKDRLCPVLKDLRTVILDPGQPHLRPAMSFRGGQGACSQRLVCGVGCSVCSAAE